MEMRNPSDKCKGSIFDDVYKNVASFGIFQAVLFFGSCLLILQVSSNYLLLVFAMGTPNYHCSTPNVTCDPNQCCQNCTSYVFDGPFTSIVNEWNLLCDRVYLQAIVRSCFYAGNIVGSLCFGIFSDAYGRKPTMFLGAIIMALFVLLSSFADSISLLSFFLFCAGFGSSGVVVSQYVYFMEIIGPKARSLATSMYELYWSIGSMGLALLSYLIRDWRMLMLTASIPAMVLLFFWRVVPETGRWLLAHNRVDEAVNVLVKCGSKNKEPLNHDNLRTLVEQVRNNQEQNEKADKVYTVIDLIRTPKIRKWTIAVGINWFVTASLSHGMMMYISNLSGDIYINVVIIKTITIVVYLSFWLIVRKFGRRLPHLLMTLISSIICVIAVIIPDEYSRSKTAVFIIAYSISSSLWITVCLFNGELFPTVLRNKAHGFCSMVGRIGGVLAPYVAMTADLPGVKKSTPIIIFAVFALCGCIATGWIPETIHNSMHQTIEEAESTAEDYSIICCKKSSKEYGTTSTDQEENHENNLILENQTTSADQEENHEKNLILENQTTSTDQEENHEKNLILENQTTSTDQEENHEKNLILENQTTSTDQVENHEKNLILENQTTSTDQEENHEKNLILENQTTSTDQEENHEKNLILENQTTSTDQEENHEKNLILENQTTSTDQVENHEKSGP